VISADGRVIGAVKTMFLDAATWRVESLGVELRKDIADELGAGRSMFHPGTLELPVRLIESVGADAVVLGVAVDLLREAHRATVGAVPASPP
jgi:sporulation protein YlmC with PRC-barrel domain